MRTRQIQQTARFQRGILIWYSKNRRDLPWRRTRDPYAILVSEIMLQQTQVPRVVVKYQAWLKRFPSFTALARAKPASVIRAWQGLGYNRRSLNLWRLAQAVVRDHGGRLPSDEAALRQLPGVGPYTQAAIRAFAFRQDVAAMDTNIRRVVSRVIVGPKEPPADRLVVLANKVVPKKRGYEWNSALMDFGSAICTSKPKCEICPLQKMCRAYPAILSQPRVQRQTSEPTAPRSTTPARIIRGRVIEQLRLVKRPLTGESLARAVITNYRLSDWPWFVRLYRRLERDGLLRITGQGRKISVTLP